MKQIAKQKEEEAKSGGGEKKRGRWDSAEDAKGEDGDKPAKIGKIGQAPDHQDDSRWDTPVGGWADTPEAMEGKELKKRDADETPGAGETPTPGAWGETP